MAASDDPRVKFGLSCPVGGQFHICQDTPTRFIGCCGTDPCTPDRKGECPISELFVASYSASSGVEFLPQSCAAPFDSSIWYTCDYARPPFLGCCMNNPCSNPGGCLAGHLVPATLSDDPKNSSQFMLPETTTSSPSILSTSVLPAGTQSPSPSPNPTAGGRARAGMIAGIAVAGVVVLLLVIAAYLWVKRREQAYDKSEQNQMFRDGPSVGAIQSDEVFQVASPVEESTFLALHSNRSSRDPRGGMPSPPVSEKYRSPHASQLSELEGSSGMIRALQPNLRDAYRGFDGHES
ncbi:hypothetical protein F5X98DRAFT_379545 [Xylaria grammica]|nr:hypothetical protein F5X98DRAFT_379545 [Xylaria grammica]